MKLTEILDQAERSKAQGVSFVVLTVKRTPRGKRMRVLGGQPTLFGRVIGSNAQGTQVDVSVAELEHWLVLHLSEVEGAAVHAAERGDNEKADEMFAEFIALRDRLARRGPPSGSPQPTGSHRPIPASPGAKR